MELTKNGHNLKLSNFSVNIIRDSNHNIDMNASTITLSTIYAIDGLPAVPYITDIVGLNDCNLEKLQALQIAITDFFQTQEIANKLNTDQRIEPEVIETTESTFSPV